MKNTKDNGKNFNQNFRYHTVIFCLFCQAQSQNKTYRWGDEVKQLMRIDQLPRYRHHQLIDQESSYDRTGGNDDGFSGKYSYIRKEKGSLVLAELEGPGVVNRIWTPTPTEDTLLFYF